MAKNTNLAEKEEPMVGELGNDEFELMFMQESGGAPAGEEPAKETSSAGEEPPKEEPPKEEE